MRTKPITLKQLQSIAPPDLKAERLSPGDGIQGEKNGWIRLGVNILFERITSLLYGLRQVVTRRRHSAEQRSISRGANPLAAARMLAGVRRSEPGAQREGGGNRALASRRWRGERPYEYDKFGGRCPSGNPKCRAMRG